jgi:hypothetical protein
MQHELRQSMSPVDLSVPLEATLLHKPIVDVNFAMDSNYSYCYTYVCSPFHTKKFIHPTLSELSEFCDRLINLFCPSATKKQKRGRKELKLFSP